MEEEKILEDYPETAGLSIKRDERKSRVLALKLREGVPVLQFEKLAQCAFADHFITTRAGGVSDGMYSTMNFSITLGDRPENVRENYRRVAGAMQSSYEDLIATMQTHTTNILRVGKEDRGLGISRHSLEGREYRDVDGLVTDVPEIVLSVYSADCVPLLFLDPVHRAIGAAHSGWRGTAGDMAGKMVARMRGEFGSLPGDLLVGVGPSICQECYEVDEAVAGVFRSLLPEANGGKVEADAVFGRQGKVLLPGREEGKYQLDLWRANVELLLRAGVPAGNIQVTDLCTDCNPRFLFSHRASRGKRGNMGTFLKIRSEV